MVTTKHCCYGLCTSDSRYPQKGVCFLGFGNGFPKPNKEKEKCIRWVNNCGRRDFTINNVNKDTYICSLHFVGGNGPTDENPDPIIKLEKEVTRPRKRRAQMERNCTTSEKRVKTAEDDKMNVAEVLVQFSEPKTSFSTDSSQLIYTCEPCSPVRSSSLHVNSATVDNSTQTEKHIAENVRLSIEKRLLENELKLMRSAVEVKSAQKCKNEIFPENESVVKGKFIEGFSIDEMKNDDKKLRFYTGLTYSMFFSLWNFLGPSASKLSYWNSEITNPEKTPSKSRGQKRKLKPQDELLLTLMKLRLGLLHADLAYRFRISSKQVSTIQLTWIQFLYLRFSDVKQLMFASRFKLPKHLPKCLEKYKNIRCIIDCTEVHLQQPTKFGAQGNAYSSYKGHVTFKFLVGIAPNGSIMYVSDAYQGNISDEEIVRQSGFLDLLEPGDVIMAGRGFLIQDLLNKRQVKVIIPPFLSGHDRLTPQEESLTKDVAKRAEQSIQRMKKFRILKKVMPLSLQSVFSQCVFVIACLVNFQKPLVQ